jgi:ubiquitin carboxyl-terminal hydrolase 34
LELSERMDYNPYGFCFAFKEFDGSPTNTAEQKDAQEFLNLLFDRLETALKPTSRKYLLQGIFGGKQCSQMVCTECGKVKNRHEDFYNLSLNIKDIKSIYESLEKLVEGEIISDYQCDGCNRKVDLSKRTLIAETPNVLIVHLQRIGFNFDTFENDKMNTLCKFPAVLDLKPYSFFEVMGKENRLVSQQEEKSPSKLKEDEDLLTEEEIAKRKEDEEEKREPVQEDCFEYKLVGVNVHSGTANMGHYWSYINTNRGNDEKDGDVNWVRTEADPWMEFNDSRVSDWEFKELRSRTFGNEANKS